MLSIYLTGILMVGMIYVAAWFMSVPGPKFWPWVGVALVWPLALMWLVYAIVRDLVVDD